MMQIDLFVWSFVIDNGFSRIASIVLSGISSVIWVEHDLCFTFGKNEKCRFIVYIKRAMHAHTPLKISKCVRGGCK